MEISGVSAIVSGGASGLGEATVRALVDRGAHCTILDRDGQRGEVLAEELGDRAGFALADVADSDQVAAAVEQAGEAGPLRVAVSCAGIAIASRLLSRDGTPHDLSAFRLVVEVNLVGTFNLMRLASAAMARTDPLEHSERGVVVNTASVAAFEGQVGQVAYSASKGGVVAMMLPAARDLSTVGVRVMTIAPGIIDTPMLGGLPEENRRALSASVPFPKRLGSPDDYAALVVHICENGYLNGETIRLDGALRMMPK
ncbi:MAG: SDR family NAD(P)-dependent oxidoreductase [Acidimicrobiales bacterium]